MNRSQSKNIMLYHHAVPTVNAAGLTSGFGLSQPPIREKQLTLANWSDSPLRLMGTIIVVLLALVAGTVLVSAMQAAVQGEPHLAMSRHEHGVHGHPGSDHVQDDRQVSHDHASTRKAQKDCADPSSSGHGSGSTDCCSMGTCHAFQVTAALLTLSPYVSAAPIGLVGDEQLDGITKGGLDRPPRTI